MVIRLGVFVDNRLLDTVRHTMSALYRTIAHRVGMTGQATVLRRPCGFALLADHITPVTPIQYLSHESVYPYVAQERERYVA
jgi:hypothetical protein